MSERVGGGSGARRARRRQYLFFLKRLTVWMSRKPDRTRVLSSSQPMPPAPTASTLARATCLFCRWRSERGEGGGWWSTLRVPAQRRGRARAHQPRYCDRARPGARDRAGGIGFVWARANANERLDTLARAHLVLQLARVEHVRPLGTGGGIGRRCRGLGHCGCCCCGERERKRGVKATTMGGARALQPASALPAEVIRHARTLALSHTHIAHSVLGRHTDITKPSTRTKDPTRPTKLPEGKGVVLPLSPSAPSSSCKRRGRSCSSCSYSGHSSSITSTGGQRRRPRPSKAAAP